ncbi:MAG: AAA family ATPase [Proteobacteria bacterium]|jgi:transitional endoplasmic reticulum ATPase|nr:AAA family ATPase [Alphaproteobacteria bacterium]NCC02996.1 AAA family ATPase [Pseudomonadota bacterium]
MNAEIALTLYETPETEDGVIHIDLSDMRQLGVITGDVIAVEGERRVHLFVQPALMGDRNQRLARVSSLTAKNLGYTSGQRVRLLPDRYRLPIAELVTLQTEDDIDQIHVVARQRQIGTAWGRHPISEGDELRVPTLDRYDLRVKVTALQPAGPVQIGSTTEFVITSQRLVDTRSIKIGGMRETYRLCQSFAKARFTKSPNASPSTILLSGPSGCGKARMLARLAQDMGVAYHVLDAQKLMDRWLARTPPDLTGYLVDLGKRGKTILVFDHLEVLESKSNQTSTIAAAASSVTGQICSILEEMPTQPTILVFGVCSGELAPRIAHAQLFDFIHTVDAPNRWSRGEILQLAVQAQSVADDVDLSALSAMTGGMTARELNYLVKSASLLAAGAKISTSDFIAALRLMPIPDRANIRCDIPTTIWDELAGLDDVKQLLLETVPWSLKYNDRFVRAGVRPPRSILLSGGPGTGKTSLIRALASRLPINFVEIVCPVLSSRHDREGLDLVQEAFALARRKAPCVLFFDDIDALFEGHDNLPPDSFGFGSAVTQLLIELDAIATLPGVVVIAATNRPDRLNSEIMRPGRFDFALTLPMPDMPARKKILQIHARKLLLAENIDFDRLASGMHGMSPADIAALCNRVGMMALRQSLAISTEDGDPLTVVTAELFEQALRGRNKG